MANQEELKRKKSKKKKRTDPTPFIVIGVIAIILVAVIYFSTRKPPLVVTDPEFHAATITDGLTMGDPNAPVRLDEYADYQCPGCGYYWSNIEPDIVKNYVETGKVFYTFTPFSFVGSYVQNNPWDESKKAAEASFCANDQGKYWDYRDYIFGNQDGENQGRFSRELLLEFAKRLDLDMETFTECFDNSVHAQAVEDANQTAIEAGLNQTPSFVVNGTIVEDGDIIGAIEKALAE